MRKPKTPKRPYPRYQTKIEGTSMTKQIFKDECNINNIMAKFERTGAIDHYAKYAPHYGDATNVDLQDALNTVISAQEMFDELPATLRKRFSNDPGEFLDFVQNPENQEEMYELGLKVDKRAVVRQNVSQRRTDIPVPASMTSPETSSD